MGYFCSAAWTTQWLCGRECRFWSLVRVPVTIIRLTCKCHRLNDHWKDGIKISPRRRQLVLSCLSGEWGSVCLVLKGREATNRVFLKIKDISKMKWNPWHLLLLLPRHSCPFFKNGKNLWEFAETSVGWNWPRNFGMRSLVRKQWWAGFLLVAAQHGCFFWQGSCCEREKEPNSEKPEHLLIADFTCGDFPGPGNAESKVLVNPMSEYIQGRDEHVHEMFDKFRKKHNKKYNDENEAEKRKMIFRDNIRFVVFKIYCLSPARTEVGAACRNHVGVVACSPPLSCCEGPSSSLHCLQGDPFSNLLYLPRIVAWYITCLRQTVNIYCFRATATHTNRQLENARKIKREKGKLSSGKLNIRGYFVDLCTQQTERDWATASHWTTWLT